MFTPRIPTLHPAPLPIPAKFPEYPLSRPNQGKGLDAFQVVFFKTGKDIGGLQEFQDDQAPALPIRRRTHVPRQSPIEQAENLAV